MLDGKYFRDKLTVIKPLPSMSGVFCFFASSLPLWLNRIQQMKYLTIAVFVVIQLSMLITSCHRSEKSPGIQPGETAAEASGTSQIIIHRYEKALFSIPKNSFRQGLDKIAPEYKVFLGDNYSSPEATDQLLMFVADPQNQQVYSECIKRFPDLNQLTAGFSEAFGRMKKEIPGIKIPAIYTYVSGFDFEYPIKYSDSALIIALDMYLGSDYKGYNKMGMPLYISSRLTPDHILPDCMKEISLALIKTKKTPVLLDAMIEQGKMLYFADALLPETEDNIKIGYSAKQLAWCSDNEKNLWEFLIGNELLFSAEAQSMSMFMTDGPFTSSFSQESPARTGAWLGWQIVRAYMKNNSIPFADLLADTDSQKILEKSGYKPGK